MLLQATRPLRCCVRHPHGSISRWFPGDCRVAVKKSRNTRIPRQQTQSGENPLTVQGAILLTYLLEWPLRGIRGGDCSKTEVIIVDNQNSSGVPQDFCRRSLRSSRAFLKSRRRFLQQLGGAGPAALAAPLRGENPQPKIKKRGLGIPQVQHIICLCQENHSFDHYFGSYSGLPSGYGIPANYTSGGQSPFHFTTLTDNNNDPNHDWDAIHTGYANGAMNGWYEANGINALGYYESSDLAYYYSLIPQYETNGTLDSSTYPCIQVLLGQFGITFANYNFGVPDNSSYLALWSNWATGGPNNELNQSQSQFLTNCSNNMLPNVVFITNESPNDEHPPEDIQNVPQRFVTSFVWDVPAPHSEAVIAKALLRNWKLSGILTLQSGMPFNISANGDVLANGGTEGAYVDLIGSGNPVLHASSKGAEVAEYFDTSRFAEPAVNTYGTLGRDILVGPGFANMDASLAKGFRPIS